jgi:uncharacterized membrane protein
MNNCNRCIKHRLYQNTSASANIELAAFFDSLFDLFENGDTPNGAHVVESAEYKKKIVFSVFVFSVIVFASSNRPTTHHHLIPLN